MGDHFVYISGDHGSGWIDKDVIYPHTNVVERLTQILGGELKKLNAQIIYGPATGGLVISQWLAHHMHLLSVFAEHGTAYGGKEMRGTFVLKRYYDHRLVNGKRVIVVDDIVNTGHSIKQTIEAVTKCGGEVVGGAAICSRGNVDHEGLAVENFVFLTEIKIPAWPASECKLCADGVPVNTDYAHGADFLATITSGGRIRS